MSIKKVFPVDWKEVEERVAAQGVQLVSDKEPKSTASGYRDGGRFCLCWLEQTPTATLEIEKISNEYSPAEDPLVRAISELLLGSLPFCMYRNRNRKDLIIFEWRKQKYQEARKDVLQNMKDVYDFVDL